MDPSASLCLSYDSLKQSPPSIPHEIVTQWYTQDSGVSLTPRYDVISIRSAPLPIYCDTNRYSILQKVKDAFNNKDFIQARDETNPFEHIGRSIFINRAAIKLANIDAVHNVTEDVFTFDQKVSPRPFTFCDIAAGPGGFTQYMQYRFPNAKGYGMTLRNDKLDWSTKFIDMTRFTPFYGADNTGDLYTNWDQLIGFMSIQQPTGVDLVTADGGFDLEDTTDKTLLHQQEFLSSRLLLTQALVGIACCKLGGNFVLKVFDTVTKFSAHVLFVLSLCFDQIIIFKPISSRPANAERYVICIGRKVEVQGYFQLLAGAARLYDENNYLGSLFAESVPLKFEQWLTRNNIFSIDTQLVAAQNIILTLQGSKPEIPRYNVDKFLIIWNLPDTPPNPKRTAIKII